ncbi:MAG: radical SAM protein [Spirochaetes bacterium]|nr:MAG: radical SAM protein [Spirochaetota bacterium]
MPKTQITIPVFVPHLGCPHTCVFCNQRVTAGGADTPTPDQVRGLILHYLGTVQPGVRRIEVAFFGGSFTAINPSVQRALLGTAREFLEAGTVHGIRVSTRPDCVDEPALELLAEYGVDTVELGAQSLDDGVLSLADRGHSAEDIRRAFRAVRGRGMRCVLQLMCGLPGDTHAKAVGSAREAALMNPDGARIYPVVVLPGTGLETLFREGRYVPLTLEQAVETAADMTGEFSCEGVPVIRTGLHPLRPEEAARIVSGPYHPAFGFLVRARLRRREAESLLAAALDERRLEHPKRVVLVLPERKAGEYLGGGRENLEWLRARHPGLTLEFRVEPLAHALTLELL